DAVWSTINLGTTTQAGQGWAGYEGTSQATPHVAGTVALMQSKYVNTPATVEAILKNTARSLPIACPEGCGAGIIDAYAAVIAAVPPPTLSIGDVSISEGNSGSKVATFTVALSKAALT